MKRPQFDECQCCGVSFDHYTDESLHHLVKATFDHYTEESLHHMVKPECQQASDSRGNVIDSQLYWTCQTCGCRFAHEDRPKPTTQTERPADAGKPIEAVMRGSVSGTRASTSIPFGCRPERFVEMDTDCGRQDIWIPPAMDLRYGDKVEITVRKVGP